MKSMEKDFAKILGKLEEGKGIVLFGDYCNSKYEWQKTGIIKSLEKDKYVVTLYFKRNKDERDKIILDKNEIEQFIEDLLEDTIDVFDNKDGCFDNIKGLY